MVTKKEGVGVAIGRFQVHELHDGHLALLNKASEHTKLVVFICVGSHLITQSDPLDYQSRALMVAQAYPGAVVHPLSNQPTDRGWSAQIDSFLGTYMPTDKPTLYFGRSSSIASYLGRHKTAEIDAVPHISGTDLRAEVGKTVLGAAGFRAGIIYAAHNMWPRPIPVVDIAVTRVRDGKREALLGKRRSEEGALRFPGGHVDLKDKTARDAAKRELAEETGLEAGNWELIDNVRVISWRDAKGVGYFTTLFHCEHVHGEAAGADDIDEVVWVPLSQLLNHKFADTHEVLAQLLIDFLARKDAAHVLADRTSDR